MSIAIIAPQMFDFQDTACVEMMLRFFFTDARFFVEPKNGEDAELQFAQTDHARRVLFQIKGSSSAVTLATIASCMAHTPNRTEKDTLLEQMIADQNLLVVFVMTGRCDDASSIYTVSSDWDGTPHTEGQVSTKHARFLLNAFSKARVRGARTSRLHAKRQEHNAKFAKAANNTVVRNALHRLLIIERVNDATLKSICAERLRKDHRVPNDRLSDVLGRLRSVVKAAKGNGRDAFALLRETLESAAPPSVRPLDYILRDAEPAWAEELSSSGVLLLSGIPRVGKSFAARWMAAEFESQGYEILESNDIGQVERFLEDPTAALRLAILDDPLGSTSAVVPAGSELARIKRLIVRLRSDRKLIVAQGEPQLLAAARVPALTAMPTARKSWHDLGASPTSFLLKVWKSAIEKFDVPCRLGKFICEALSNGSLILEPGCLEHLAAHHDRLEGELKLDQISRLAREESVALGQELAREGHEEILSTLALTTVAQDRIAVGELAFTMGSGGSTLPGKSTHGGVGVVIGRSPRVERPGLSYDEAPELSGQQRELLDRLERLGAVKVDSDRAGFSHPFYRSAAESLVDGLTDAVSKRIVSAVQRGLFCLSPVTSRATAKNLEWVFDKLSARVDAQSALVAHAVDGLMCYFPVTRDLCFRFLVERLEDLPIERQSELPQWISQVTFICLNNIVWSNGQAHLPFDDMLDGNDFGRVERSAVEAELYLLNGTADDYVSPDRAAKALKFLRNDLGELTLRAMGRFLSYDVAALRAEAVKLWLSRPRDDDDLVLARMFRDDHPSCAVGALKGAIAGWSEYSELRRTQVLSGMCTLAKNIVCAAPMLDHLVVFDKVETTGKAPPWAIFEELMPIVMRVLPYNAVFHDARLYSVVRSAAKRLSAASIVEICDSWIGWLERNAAQGILPREYSLGVGEVLLSSTARDPELRRNKIGRMLAFQGTGALIVFVADFVDGWDRLSQEERTAILCRLRSERSDDVWLQAAAITRSTVPGAVQRVVLGDRVSLSEGADALLEKVPSDVLNAAIQVYSGRPQPLWWLGTHHSAEAVWEPVIESIARAPDHPLFELAWDHIAFGGDGVRMSKIIECVGQTEADRMLDILIRLKVGWTGNYMPEAWASVLAMAKDEAMRASWMDKMVRYVPAILDDLSDLKHWLSEDRDLLEMLHRLKSDYIPLQISESGTENLDRVESFESDLSRVQLLKMVLENNPPRLFGTCDRVVSRLQSLDVPTADLIDELKHRRKIILDDRKRIKEEFDQEEISLRGWISP